MGVPVVPEAAAEAVRVGAREACQHGRPSPLQQVHPPVAAEPVLTEPLRKEAALAAASRAKPHGVFVDGPLQLGVFVAASLESKRRPVEPRGRGATRGRGGRSRDGPR